MAIQMKANPTVWKKRILIPLLALRLVLMLFVVAIFGIALNTIKNERGLALPNISAVVIFILLIVIIILMDVMAILMFLRDGLNPKKFLIMNVVQTTLWVVVVLLNVGSIAKEHSSGSRIGFSIFVLFNFLGLLSYAATGFFKSRKQLQRGQYAPTHNPAAQPFMNDASQYNAPEYQNTQSFQQGPHDSSSAYKPAAYEPRTSYQPSTGSGVELDSPRPQGAANDYYTQQPARAAHRV